MVSIEHQVAFAVCLFVLIVGSRTLGNRLTAVPESLILVILGFGAGLLVTSGLGLDTGVRASSFHDLIFFVFLPVLVFEAALEIGQRQLLHDSGYILFLAIVGVALTTAVAGFLIFWGIGHPTGFPLIAALLSGALLAATDPVAVVAQLKSLGASPRLGVLLEGESLFNDATAIALFSILLSVALMPEGDHSVFGAVGNFFYSFVGGTAIGLVFGWAGATWLRASSDASIAVVMSLAVAYGSFILAEAAFHMSGVMAALAAGLLIARQVPDLMHAAHKIWETLTDIANGCVFLLMGLTFTVEMFSERWLAMLIAIAAVLLARFAVTFLGVGLLNLAYRDPLDTRMQTALAWGGLRGGVTLALALSLPQELPYWWTIQSMAFGVVLFTMVVQASSMPWLLRRLRLIG